MLIKRGTSLKKAESIETRNMWGFWTSHSEQCEVSIMYTKSIILVQGVSKIKKNHYKSIEIEFLFLASEWQCLVT